NPDGWIPEDKVTFGARRPDVISFHSTFIVSCRSSAGLRSNDRRFRSPVIYHGRKDIRGFAGIPRARVHARETRAFGQIRTLKLRDSARFVQSVGSERM